MAWNIGYKKKRKKDYIIIKTEFSPIFPQKKSDSSLTHQLHLSLLMKACYNFHGGAWQVATRAPTNPLSFPRIVYLA